MTENKLRTKISILFILTHFIVILLIVIFRMLGWYGSEDFSISLPIIVPMFASFTTLIVLYIIENKNNLSEDLKRVNSLFVFISFFIPTVFILFLLTIVIKQAFVPDTTATFTAYLGVSESIFGVYIGYILKSLFKTKKGSENEQQ